MTEPSDGNTLYESEAAFSCRPQYLNLGEVSRHAHTWLNELIRDYKTKRAKDKTQGRSHGNVVQVEVVFRVRGE